MREPSSLTPDEIEAIEKLSLRALFIAVREFGSDAWDFFHQSSDDPKDVAEDTTREMLDRLGGYGIPQRIYGNVDYRKARFVMLPELATRQALFVDSKAEKQSNTATLQMSQLSMRVRQYRGGEIVDEAGKIGVEKDYNGCFYLSTILLVHYHYLSERYGSGKDVPPYVLKQVTLAAIPSGKLQDQYNPDHSDTIWSAGRNAPTRGEDFRVRLNFRALKNKKSWRVQSFTYDPGCSPLGVWSV